MKTEDNLIIIPNEVNIQYLNNMMNVLLIKRENINNILISKLKLYDIKGREVLFVDLMRIDNEIERFLELTKEISLRY